MALPACRGDYTGPVLGPPLPGDLGRPILDAQNKGQPVVPPDHRDAHGRRGRATAARLRKRPREQARCSSRPLPAHRLPAHRGEVQSCRISPVSTSAVNLASRPCRTSSLPSSTPPSIAAQPRRIASRRRPRPSCFRQAPSSPAALIAGIRSDLPGQITAQVTENIYDSPTGRILLVPQGTRIIGQYDNNVEFGQRRVLLVWNRLILPNGRSIVLERQPGADTQGYAGLEDGVDYHWWDLAKAAGLSTLLAVGSELAVSDEARLVRAIRDGSQDTINDAGQQIIQRQLQVAPTLTIRPGFPVRIIVTRDLVFEPYRG